jgi:hypothetical protein
MQITNLKSRLFKIIFCFGLLIVMAGCAAKTPLIQASINGDYDEAKKLVQGGANINEPDSNGDTPLISAIRKGKVEVAKYLIESGADIRAKNKQGYDALLCAVDEVDYGQLEIVKILINKGANLESKDLSGRTPLVVAAVNVSIYHFPNADVVKLLVESGANTNARSAEGETVLDLALSSMRGDIVDALIRAGINLWTPDAGKARLFFVGTGLWDYVTVTVGKQSKRLNQNKYVGLAFIDVDSGNHAISVSGKPISSIDVLAGQTYFSEVTQDMKRRAAHYAGIKLSSVDIIPLTEGDAKKEIKELLRSKEIK